MSIFKSLFYYEARLVRLPKGLIVNTLSKPIYFKTIGAGGLAHVINTIIPPSTRYDSNTHTRLPTSVAGNTHESDYKENIWYIVSREMALQMIGKPNILFPHHEEETHYVHLDFFSGHIREG
jgi:hypothetical protein